jgi:hypothetical protein
MERCHCNEKAPDYTQWAQHTPPPVLFLRRYGFVNHFGDGSLKLHGVCSHTID